MLFIIEGVHLNLAADGSVESVTDGRARWPPTRRWPKLRDSGVRPASSSGDRTPSGSSAGTDHDSHRYSGRREDLTAPLLDPEFYAGDPFPLYARLRAEAPVARNERSGCGW